METKTIYVTPSDDMFAQLALIIPDTIEESTILGMNLTVEYVILHNLLITQFQLDYDRNPTLREYADTLADYVRDKYGKDVNNE